MAENARLEELRRKRADERAQLQTLTRQNMTLAEARQELASLDEKVAGIRKEVERVRRLAPWRSSIWITRRSGKS